MSTTFDLGPSRRTARVQRSTSTLSAGDAELSRLGITTEEQALVYRAIEAGGVRHESGVIRASGLDAVRAIRALHTLQHMRLVRRVDTHFGSTSEYEVVKPKR